MQTCIRFIRTGTGTPRKSSFVRNFNLYPFSSSFFPKEGVARMSQFTIAIHLPVYSTTLSHPHSLNRVLGQENNSSRCVSN